MLLARARDRSGVGVVAPRLLGQRRADRRHVRPGRRRAPPPTFEPVVGDWYMSDLAGARGLRVDGSKWRKGTPSAKPRRPGRRLYGERYAEFLDGVKAFAFFPLAV